MGIETTPQAPQDDKIDVPEEETKAEGGNKIEELKQKIKAAEEVLESLNQQLRQKEYQNFESSSKLEWGPNLGETSLKEAQKKLDRLNSNLKEGEERWRLPTVYELSDACKRAGGTPPGFSRDSYLSSQLYEYNLDASVVVEMGNIRDDGTPFTHSFDTSMRGMETRFVRNKEENLTKRGRKDVPTPDAENMETSKLEWGPELGKMTWENAQIIITELNSKLAEGENPWRIPTLEELRAEFKKTGSTPGGFQIGHKYSADYHGGNTNMASIVYISDDGPVSGWEHKTSRESYYIRCVRDLNS